MIFSVFKKNRVWGILGPLSYGVGATICIGPEMLCLPYAAFFTCDTQGVVIIVSKFQVPSYTKPRQSVGPGLFLVDLV